LSKGLFEFNPTFVLTVGLCPTLAVTTSLKSALAIGVAVIAVLTCSNAIIAASWRGPAGGLGFTVAMILMSSVRERLAHADTPEPLKGMPIAFVCTSMMAMAFLGFSGMI